MKENHIAKDLFYDIESSSELNRTFRISLMIAGFGYTTFVGANLYPQYYTLIPAAVVLGLSASILWSAQGVHYRSIF